MTIHSRPHPAPPRPAAGPPAAGPILAMVVNELTPYRVHFHRRLAREIPELTLATLLVQDSARSPWRLDDPSINTVRLADGELARAQRGPGSRFGSARRRAAALLRWLDEHRPVAVFINGYNDWPMLRALSWCRVHRVPSLLWADSNVHGDRASGWRRMLKGVILPRIFRSCSAVLPCGSLGRQYLLSYGAEERRIFFCPYEPDYHALAALDPALVAEVKRTLGLDERRRRIVVCARMIPVKRIDLAIDAFTAIAQERPEWDLVIVGDGPLRDALTARIPGPLRARVVMTGFIARQETVTAIYAASHVLLHPAEYEPWALVINEAAAAGLAIVTTSVVGAAAELVRDHANGRVVPPGDPALLSDALREATDPVRLGPMRAASKEALADWRRRADPVAGLRAALRFTGALRDPPAPSA